MRMTAKQMGDHLEFLKQARINNTYKGQYKISSTPIKEEKPKLEVGQIWHVRLATSACLATRRVLEITEKTVVLNEPSTSLHYGENRYLISDLEFIELVK